jgi:hypothetical protein
VQEDLATYRCAGFDPVADECERRLKTDNKRRRHSAAAPHARMKTGIREAFNPTLNGTLIQGTA